MSGLVDALEAGAKAAYGEGWELLDDWEQEIVRDRMRPVLDAILVQVSEGIAEQLDRRAQAQAGCKHVAAHKQLTYAARDVRAWS